jgi:hypothetical protein
MRIRNLQKDQAVDHDRDASLDGEGSTLARTA